MEVMARGLMDRVAEVTVRSVKAETEPQINTTVVIWQSCLRELCAETSRHECEARMVASR